MFTLSVDQGNNSHNINDMLFIEENIYMILKVFDYKKANMASLFIGMTVYCRVREFSHASYRPVILRFFTYSHPTTHTHTHTEIPGSTTVC